MCGIVGIFHRDGAPASQPALERMNAAVAHRGPDGEGIFLDGCLGLGHRRLSIIDLSPAGRQPMQSACGRYTLAYNGELYNFRELRRELEIAGHHFRSRTDTEVVLNALITWGQRALDRFNGMFALALWDHQQRELFLARDRYGIKPLYYTQRDGLVLFGSEVKAILAHGATPAAIDPEALVEYLTFQNFYGERTLFAGVRLLPPGCCARLRQGTAGAVRPERYWDFEFHDEPQAGEDELAAELDGLLEQAIRRQLVSDVEVGSYLSGGLDSGTITAIASRQLPHMRTFTGGFDLRGVAGAERRFDERAKAEHISHCLGTEHHEVVMKAADVERVMRRLTWHLEEPRVGQSYPNFFASQLASKFVKVVLGGTGGDELFGGYPWRYYRTQENLSFDQYVDRYFPIWQRLIPSEVFRRACGPMWNEARHVEPRELFQSVFKHNTSPLTSPSDFVNRCLYFEASTFLHGLLVVEDKISMAHGLETRVPLLDNNLVDFAMRVPVKFKLAHLDEPGARKPFAMPSQTPAAPHETSVGKRLLRRVMKRYVPEEIAHGHKQGFSAPDASWFKGESLTYVHDVLFNPAARIYDFLDRTTMTNLVNEHLSGQANRRLLIWSLLYLETWCELFASGSQHERRPAAA